MTTHPAPNVILAAVDYSDFSPLVVERAVSMARLQQADQIHFVHVRQPGGDDQTWLGRQHELRDWLAARLSTESGVPYTVRVVAHEEGGNPADVIIFMARELAASLVVVGTHGRKGVERLLMGSVAEAVVRGASCPVLVVRPIAHEPVAPGIEPPCPRCLEAREESQGAVLWCEQHDEKHGRRHTYYDTRHETWVNQRITL